MSAFPRAELSALCKLSSPGCANAGPDADEDCASANCFCSSCSCCVICASSFFTTSVSDPLDPVRPAKVKTGMTQMTHFLKEQKFNNRN